ncbi:MAG: phenylalanine--tRNA ligase subunit alpha [Bacteroidota bacterium]
MQSIEEKIAAQRVQAAEFPIQNKEELEKYRLAFLVKNGSVQALMNEFRDVAPEKRREVGMLINELKEFAKSRFDAVSEELENSGAQAVEHPDFSLPPVPDTLGSRHPLSLVREEIVAIFTSIGFNLSEGPEIEDDWHNFGALNFPEHHPARDMQDTFFVEQNPDITLRTHTSSVQVRVMEGSKPPIRTISPGRVFRNEAISARAHCVFHQVEGLYINKNVSFADLKQTLYYFVRELFGKDVKIRFRPSYFPFTEPSAEMDIDCRICHGSGCNVCKYTGWVEIAGSGMVDPAVLTNCGIDPEEYTGFAFGMGLERIAMLKYEVRDLRLYTENDIRFLRQFSGQV